MLAILYHSFYKWEFRGVAPQQGFHSACYRFRHTLRVELYLFQGIPNGNLAPALRR